jgi:drug/metabolite transporter (DMT)-like permease
MVTYLPPVVAAVAGVVLLNEHLSWYQPVGGVIVLLGVGVSQGLVGLVTRRARRRRTRTTVDPTNPAVAVATTTSPKT